MEGAVTSLSDGRELIPRSRQREVNVQTGGREVELSQPAALIVSSEARLSAEDGEGKCRRDLSCPLKCYNALTFYSPIFLLLTYTNTIDICILISYFVIF